MTVKCGYLLPGFLSFYNTLDLGMNIGCSVIFWKIWWKEKILARHVKNYLNNWENCWVFLAWILINSSNYMIADAWKEI